MKKMTIIIIALFFAFTGSISARGYRGQVDFNYFYSALNPYGEWIEIDYDVYVWRPNSVHMSWSPYTIGRWEFTTQGWYWDSYEPFGWATYHYGRWFNDDYYGWVWMPDYEWGPSWVEWRYNDVYIGWAPLPPYASFRVGVGIYFSTSWNSRPHYWNFVTYNNFQHHHINQCLISSRYRQNIFNNTKYRTNYYSERGRIFNGGVDRNYIERRSGSSIPQRDIVTTTKLRDASSERIPRSEVEVYRPSEDDIQKTRGINKYEFKKVDRQTSLERDKISVTKTEINATEKIANRDPKSSERKINDYSRIGSKDSSREVIKEQNNRSIESNSKRSTNTTKPESVNNNKSRNPVDSGSKIQSSRSQELSKEKSIIKSEKLSSSNSGKSNSIKSNVSNSRQGVASKSVTASRSKEKSSSSSSNSKTRR